MPSNTDPIQVLIEGNSMSMGLDPGLGVMLNAEYGSGRFELTNFAASGQATDTMLSDFDSGVGPAIVDNATFCTLWSLVNDFYLSTPNPTARTAVDNLWSWCDQANALGARVIVLTPTPRSNTGTPADYDAHQRAHDLDVARPRVTRR